MAFKNVLAASNNGPVFYGMRYGSAPVRTKSHPNGTTRRAARWSPIAPRSGHARFPGVPGQERPTGSHRGLPEGPQPRSPNRPEKPPYDTISGPSGPDRVRGYHTILGQSLYAAVPTERCRSSARSRRRRRRRHRRSSDRLKPFDGTAEIDGNGHFAVQLADREFVALGAGLKKDVVALGRLSPRLPGPAGDRTNVALVGDEAAILLRADIILRDRAGNVIERPPTEADEDPPPARRHHVPDGDPTTPDDELRRTARCRTTDPAG